jgi:hypothetical protein
MRPGSLWLRATTMLALVGSVVGMSCSNGIHADVKVALVFPRNAHLGPINYRVRSSSGITIVGPGELDVTDQQDTVGIIVSLPTTADGDEGDTIALDATTSDNVPCTGISPPFAVLAANNTTVAVTLTCGSEVATIPTGEVEITANVVLPDSCPDITAAVVGPAETSVGSSVAVTATASDPDLGETLTYDWAPASGFANPHAQSTSYVCGAPGQQTLTFTVTDSHTPACWTSTSFTITCD